MALKDTELGVRERIGCSIAKVAVIVCGLFAAPLALTFTVAGNGLLAKSAGDAVSVSVEPDTVHVSQLARGLQLIVPRDPEPLLVTATVCTSGWIEPRIAWKWTTR
jgi:hypothetical protein